MSSRKIILLMMTTCLFPIGALGASSTPSAQPTPQLTQETIAKQLGWVESAEDACGGYYLEQPFVYPLKVDKKNSVEVTSNQTLFSQIGTSILEGKVTITRTGQQITSNKAYLYRDPKTGKLNSIEMIGNVNLREPNSLVVGKRGKYNFETKSKSLLEIFYRTSLNGKQVVGPKVTQEERERERKVTALTAWGRAYDFSQTEPQIYELSKSSFTTCPPINPAWRVKASHLTLDKNTGRGYATNARILVKNVPVIYFPYINFSIDKQRKSGFLWPMIGHSNDWGYSLLTPFYWNMAPNYDMVITPGLLSLRGVQISDRFRYLTETSSGSIYATILPNDRLFADFQSDAAHEKAYTESTNPAVQAELNRLLSDSTTRKGLEWKNLTRFNDHWSSNIDFNYAGDDYYYRDFGNLNEITQNQLLQEGDLYYKGQNWNFTGRIQAYQTLHPIDEANVLNQYRRFPQLILDADYPDQAFGLEYFINNEATHFDIRNTPGATMNLPIGNRLHTQPGISLPIYKPYFFMNPRLQLALTDYQLYQITPTHTPGGKHRAVPIFDAVSGLAFNRNSSLFGYYFQQTLEPQVYYTYIPYRNQSSIPVFDTTVNTLTYDQLFNYNRFTSIDRIGDANQIGYGISTRLIDQASGIEKVRMGIGEIIYFAKRRVTLCNSSSLCNDYPGNPDNDRTLSPISAFFNYSIDPTWSLTANSIINPSSKQLDNATTILHYQPDQDHVINIGYSFARNGDILSGIEVNSSKNNLKLTDISFSWPLMHDVKVVGRWSEDWNMIRLQNLLYGLQYDSCCWAVRFVGGRAFQNLTNNRPVYKNQYFLEFALKGLGNIGNDPSSLLKTITGYNTQFGQVI